MVKNQRSFVIVLLALGLLAALWAAYQRVRVESSNPIVALCLDYGEVQRLAALTGKTIEQQLVELREAGATHVALAESSLTDMLLLDRVSLIADSGRTRLVPQPGAEYVVEALAARLSAVEIEEYGVAGGTGPEEYELPSHRVPTAVWRGDFTGFGAIGVGYDPAALAAIAASGLQPVARPVADFCLTREAVDYSVQSAVQTGARVVVFNGTRVVGESALIKHVARRLEEHNLSFGMIELVPQQGASALATALGGRIVRCHSVSAEEMLLMSARRGWERFLLAVTERKVRLCYVRLFFTPATDIGAANFSYLSDISTSLQKLGYRPGTPEQYGQVALPTTALMLLALGVLGGLLWWMQVLKELPARLFWVIAGAGTLIAIGAPVVAPGMARSLIALAAALIFPALAICLIPARIESDLPQGGGKLLRAVGLTARTALVSLMGGLLMAGAMTDSAYLVGISQFRGVKPAQALPLLVLLLILSARATETYQRTVRTHLRWQALRDGMAEAGGHMVRYWHVALIVVATGALGYMLIRSGNEAVVGPSGFELQLRAALDRLLVVRPRTKEIFIGYPALLVGLMLLLQGRWKLSWPLLLVGAIAQVSLVNTFCHMHTPLVVSLVRVAHGLWLGILAGLVWWAIKLAGERYWRWARRLEMPRDEASSTDGEMHSAEDTHTSEA